MLTSLVAALTLAFASNTAPPTADTAAFTNSPLPGGGQFSALLESFEVSVKTHKQLIGDARDSKERSALRKQHPAYEYFSRFRDMASQGEGHSLLWMLEHARYSGEKASRRKELQAEWCEQLVAGFVDADWFEEALFSISKHRKTIGELRLIELLIGVTEKAEHENARAAACQILARTCSRSKNPDIRSQSEVWSEKLFSDYADTSYAQKSQAEYNRTKYLSVGGEPMDFAAATVDGEKFRLADYRGKIVVLDFWGFW